MSIYLSHTTAMTFWRTASSHQAKSTLPVERMPKDDATRSPLEALLIAEGTQFQDSHLHLILPEGCGARCTESVTFHESRLAKPGLFFKIKPHIYAASPELTFLQMASLLPLDELVFLGNEFCGTYVYDPFCPKGFSDRPALTTPKDITRVIKRLGAFNGKDNAIKALRSISPGTASPAENELATHLALAKTYGGAGLGPFYCNKTFAVPSHLRQLTNQATVTPDICWPNNRVALEYDSDDFHTGAERITRDSARRNTLIAMGYTTLSITRGQIRRARDLLAEDQKIARALNVRWRPRDASFEIKVQQSWRRLEHWAHTDPRVLSDELEARYF